MPDLSRDVAYRRLKSQLAGLRFPVATVVAMLADGMGTEQILAEHPDLTAEDTYEPLLYAAEAVRARAAAPTHGVKFLRQQPLPQP